MFAARHHSSKMRPTSLSPAATVAKTSGQSASAHQDNGNDCTHQLLGWKCSQREFTMTAPNVVAHLLKTLPAAASATFLALFPIVNPFGGVPLFFSLTSNSS